ncbi:Copia protein [Eumeta japonica]|uniref:Copia protein n=1 Tax=Eumeta variegata TaxID=151549 RepID=A0A4C1ZI93_EUMVA|nr:Copia protein [Eumeta japonica]
MARCLLSEAKVERYWPEIIKTAAYLKNRTLTNTVERKSPYEIFFKRKPTVKYLKMYGSRVFVRIPEERRKSKWDKKAETGILLGYTDTGYRVLINNRVIVVRHCDIVEEDVTMCGFQDERDDNLEEEKINKDISESVGRNDTDKLNSNNDIEIDEDMDKKKSKRQVKPPTRFADEFGYYCISVNYCDAMSPENFQEAMNCDDANEWKAAMDREMNSLVENKTWTLVDKPTKDKSD